MNVLDLLKGKKVKVMTDAKVEIELEIDWVKESHHSEDIGESNVANDWWPEQKEWVTYDVKFTNGHTKQYRSLEEIKIVEK